MAGSKIELSAQKEKTDGSEVRENTLQKLQDLVDKDVQRSHKQDRIIERDANQSPLYDTDGFKIPVGKIPLDGQFTVTEVEELVLLGQEEGDLNDNIQVKVDNKTSNFSQLAIIEPDEKDDEKDSDESSADNK